MKKKRFIYYSICVLLSCFLYSFQNNKFIFLKSINADSQQLTTDDLGFIYLTKGSTLNKYDSEGNHLKNFSNKNTGNLKSVDASNPLKILLFYKDFQQLLFLDNMLAPTGDFISLQELGYRQVSLACTSANGGFWIFDKQNYELIKFDHTLQKIFQSGNIRQLTNITNPVFLLEYNNNVFLSDTSTGISVFDNYGTYNKTLPLKDVQQFQMFNDLLIYFKTGKLKSYNVKTLEQEEILLPDTNIIMAQTEKEKLYLLKPKSVDIYQIKK